MIGFEPGSSGIGSDRSANCATTTAQIDAKLKTENVFASSSLENCLLIGRTDGRTDTYTLTGFAKRNPPNHN